MCLPRTISLAFAAELGKQRAADVRKDARANECFRPRLGWVIYNRCFQSFTFYWQGHSLALDENIYEIRREKLKKIESLGHPAYPRKYDFTHTVAQILAGYSGQTAEALESARVTVRVADASWPFRLMGKAGFAHLQQDGQRSRIYVKKTRSAMPDTNCGSCSTWAITSECADICFAPHGELSIHAEELTFWRRTCCPCRKNFTASPTSNCATPTLPRSGDESRSARSVFEAQQTGAIAARYFDGQGFHGSRDADDASHRRRSRGAPVQNAFTNTLDMDLVFCASLPNFI